MRVEKKRKEKSVMIVIFGGTHIWCWNERNDNKRTAFSCFLTVSANSNVTVELVKGMMLGLLGMAWYSSPSKSTPNNVNVTYQEVEVDDDDHDETDHVMVEEDDEERGEEMVENIVHTSETETVVATDEDDETDENSDDERNEAEFDDEGDDVVLVNDDTHATTLSQSAPSSAAPPPSQQDPYMVFCGMKWQRRTLGIMSAMFTGLWGGSIMVPMKWAPSDAEGLGYLISFSIGATVVTLFLWLVRYLYLCQKHNSFSKAYYALPSFHIRKMWLYGGGKQTLVFTFNFSFAS